MDGSRRLRCSVGVVATLKEHDMPDMRAPNRIEELTIIVVDIAPGTPDAGNIVCHRCLMKGHAQTPTHLHIWHP